MPINGIFLPKTEYFDSINELSQALKKENISLDIVPMIETKKGYENLATMLSQDIGSNLITKVHYGHFDYCLDSR